MPARCSLLAPGLFACSVYLVGGGLASVDLLTMGMLEKALIPLGLATFTFTTISPD